MKLTYMRLSKKNGGGRVNKVKQRASEVAARNRTLNAIYRRRAAGESPRTSLSLARLLDRAYGTHHEERYHGRGTS